MDVATVTTADHALLRAVREVLAEVDEALLCVAFVQERGLRLLEKELERRQARRASTRLLVTTTFLTTSPAALALARGLDVDVRVLNPGAGRSFHPKIYLGRAGDRSRAVIGSANLTGGLFSNHEAAVALAGSRSDVPIAAAWDWAERLWADERVETWLPALAADREGEAQLDERLFALLGQQVAQDPIFRTLAQGRPNRVVRLGRDGIDVETERSRGRTRGAEPIPAWMFNLAWERLQTHGVLTNAELLNELRVHRSSAVCAILARFPGVEQVPGREIRLRWTGATGREGEG
jgi:HKD family nuclease